MTDEQKPQSDPAERYEILTGWNLPAILYLLLAFYSLLGFLGAVWLTDYHAAAWAIVATGLALVLCNLKRWQE